jgi:hypothetical protein
VTTSQIIACAIAWTAAAVAITAFAKTRRARRPVPYTPPPREHCGNLAPQIFEHSPRVECALHPGHQGSHANERGARWWLTPKAPQDGVVCEAYRLPTAAEDSGLCARCGMSDYKHWEPRHA